MGGHPVVARGEVRWIDLDKSRPVVLLNRAAVIGRLSSLIVAPCTTRVRGLPTEVALGPKDGMPQDCVISLDNVTLVQRDALGDLITTLSDDKLDEACACLAIAVGCEM